MARTPTTLRVGKADSPWNSLTEKTRKSYVRAARPGMRPQDVARNYNRDITLPRSTRKGRQWILGRTPVQVNSAHRRDLQRHQIETTAIRMANYRVTFMRLHKGIYAGLHATEKDINDAREFLKTLKAAQISGIMDALDEDDREDTDGINMRRYVATKLINDDNVTSVRPVLGS